LPYNTKDKPFLFLLSFTAKDRLINEKEIDYNHNPLNWIKNFTAIENFFTNYTVVFVLVTNKYIQKKDIEKIHKDHRFIIIDENQIDIAFSPNIFPYFKHISLNKDEEFSDILDKNFDFLKSKKIIQTKSILTLSDKSKWKRCDTRGFGSCALHALLGINVRGTYRYNDIFENIDDIDKAVKLNFLKKLKNSNNTKVQELFIKNIRQIITLGEDEKKINF